jgi:hypothetical protein
LIFLMLREATQLATGLDGDRGAAADVCDRVLINRAESRGHRWEETLCDVMYGRPPLGKGFFGVSASGSGAVMYPAFVRGAWTAGPDGVRWSGSNHSGAL